MSTNKNIKRNTMIGVGVVVALAVGGGAYYMSHSPNKEDGHSLDEQLKKSKVTKLFAYTDNGVVKLYDPKNGKKLDSFDLKTLSTGKEVVVETKPVQTNPVKQPEKVVKEEFEGFIRVPHKVVKGENSWKIQTALTPKRDTAHMIQLVAKANGKTKLHPIYPGQTLYYLKEKDGSSPEEVVKEVQTGEPIQKEKVEKVVKKVDENAVYLYSKSEDFKTLYAYNDIEETIYKISEKDGKIHANIMYTAKNLKNVTDFKVVKDKLYIAYDGGTKVKEVDVSKNNHSKDFELKGTADLFVVRDGNLYYTFTDKLGKINLSNGKEKTILLGDKSLDYIFTKDNLFILNEFGSKKDNSIVIKVNPKNLKVDDLVELKSNETTILSEEKDSEKILIGEVSKTKDKNKVVKEEVVLPIQPKSLDKELFVKNVPFDKNAVEIDGFIYELIDGKATIYSGTSGEKTKEIEVDNATNLMPIKK